MRKPRSRLPLVHAGSLQSSLKPIGEPCGLPTRVGEDEHADRASLPVAYGLESKRRCGGCFLPKDVSDRLESLARLAAQKGERDVEARHGSTPGEMTPAPGDELLHDACRELESEKEPESVISLDGTACAHVDVCRLSNNRRTR